MTLRGDFSEEMAEVAARRHALRIGVLGLAAILTPRLAAAQTFTATSISQAAQEARRDAGLLARRADDLLRLTVADGPERGRNAVGRFRADRLALGRELAAIFNSRVSEDDWLLVAPTRELELALAMRPLVVRLAPSEADLEASFKAPLAQVEPKSGEGADDAVLAIVLATLGFGERDDVLTAQLRSETTFDAAVKSAGNAVKAHRYGLAAFEFERLMRMVVLPRHVAIIAGRRGAGAARTLYQSLVVHFVPFIGWSYFTAELLAAVYLSRDTTAPVLR